MSSSVALPNCFILPCRSGGPRRHCGVCLRQAGGGGGVQNSCIIYLDATAKNLELWRYSQGRIGNLVCMQFPWRSFVLRSHYIIVILRTSIEIAQITEMTHSPNPWDYIIVIFALMVNSIHLVKILKSLRWHIAQWIHISFPPNLFYTMFGLFVVTS